MKFNLVQFLMAVSTAIDFVELDKLDNVTNHGKRVAVIACKIGRMLHLTDEEIFDLAAYAVMHDNGYAGFQMKNKTPNMTKKHCIVGHENVKEFPYLTSHKDVILYHHENYNGSGPFHLVGDEIPLLSRIIRISDYTENMMNAGADLNKVQSNVRQQKGGIFSADMVEIFEELTEKPTFTMDLMDMFIEDSIKEIIPVYDIDISWSELTKITKIISNIIDAKSEFTGSHSSGIADKILTMSRFYDFDEDKVNQLQIAAHLHDAGKLAMPNSILDKPGSLTKEEFSIIKQHTYYTRKVLCKIDNFEDITQWASNHHEKLNGKGYPYGMDAKQLDFCSRLMACIDIYQALTEKRPYRVGLTHERTMEILSDCVKRGDIDENIVKDIDRVFGKK